MFACPDLFRLLRHEGRETTVWLSPGNCYHPILIALQTVEQYAWGTISWRGLCPRVDKAGLIWFINRQTELLFGDDRDDLGHLANFVVAKGITPMTDSTFALADLCGGFEKMTARDVFGKVVFTL